jgi:hypothetical protein
VADAACPADTIEPATTVCKAGSGDVCDPDELCSGVANEACPADGVAPTTTVCNAGSGDLCDPDELCTGVADATCPADGFEPTTTVCNAGSGDLCDPDELCTGVADAACPADSFEPDGTSCANSDTCDGSEVCQAGMCVTGSPLDCNDGNVCTADSCDSVDGCFNDPIPDCSIPVVPASSGWSRLVLLLSLFGVALLALKRSRRKGLETS